MKPSARVPWTRPLRVHLGLIIVLLLVGVSAPLLWLGFDRGRQAALAAIDDKMASLSARIVDRYRILFSDKLAFVSLAGVMDSFRSPPPDQLTDKIQFLARATFLAPDLDGIMIGYPDGSFLYAINFHDDNNKSRAALNAPPGAATAIQSISTDEADRRISTWRFLDNNRQVFMVRNAAADYDPRLRPWYKAAIEAEDPVVMPANVMPLTGNLVKTLARRHDGDPRVVVAANIRLRTIARFLDSERISPRSKAYVLIRTES